jgi:hypothetical protein
MTALTLNIVSSQNHLRLPRINQVVAQKESAVQF